jgi:hypothetical protein
MYVVVLYNYVFEVFEVTTSILVEISVFNNANFILTIQHRIVG